MDQLMPWLVSGGAGAIGGNLVGLVGKLKNLSPLIKTILGAIGGLIGGKGLEVAGLLQNLDNVKMGGMGAAAGGLVTYLIGGLMAKKTA